MSKDQLLIKLFEGALNFLRIARRGMEEKNIRAKGENISKLINIITELDCALDMESGGEITRNLSTLYQHIIFSMVNANVKDDLNALDEVEHILMNIKEGFQAAAKINRENKQSSQNIEPQVAEHKGGMSLAI